MGASNQKLLESLETNQVYKFTDICIDELIIDDNSTDFDLKIYKNFQAAAISVDLPKEDDDAVVERYLELFKQDTVINFTDPAIGKEIPVLPSNNGKNFI